MKRTIYFKKYLSTILFASLALSSVNPICASPTTYYATTPRIPTSSISVHSPTEFKNVVCSAINNLDTSITVKVLERDPNLENYSAILDSPEGIKHYSINGIRYNKQVYLTISWELKQTFKVTQAIKNPTLSNRLNTSDKNLLVLAQSIIKQITNDSMSDYEKEVAIHDYIVNNTSYDADNLATNTLPDYAYTAYGVLVKKKAVCEGYSEATKLLCNLAGIECEIVRGSSSDYNLHAWNIVKIDGDWYMLDTTYDDPIFYNEGKRVELITHDYFNITNVQLSKDHSWDTSKYPKAVSSNYNYYQISGQIINSYEQFKTYILSEIKVGKKKIVCYINAYDEKVYDLSFLQGHYTGEISYLKPQSSSGTFTLMLT